MNQKPPSFLILTQYYAPEIGAAPLRNAAIARELAKRGFEVRVLTTFPSHRMKEIPPRYRRRLFMRERVDGIEVVRIWAWPHPKKSLWGRLVSYATFMVTSVIGAAFAPRPGYVFVHTPPIFLALSALAIGRVRGARVIVNVSDIWPASAQAVGAVRSRTLLAVAETIARFIYRRAWRVTVATKQIGDEIARKGVTSERIVFLPNGADTDLFKPTTQVEPPGIDEAPEGFAEHTFIYAGNVGVAQDFETIVRAAEILRSRTDISLVVVGEGPRKEWLANEVRDRRLENFLVLDAVPPYALPGLFSRSVASLVTLRNADLFLGARPSKIFVSLACARPVIYAGAGEAADLINEAGAGIVVDPENPEALARAVAHLADHPEEARRMGEAGRRLVEREYSWSTIVARFLDDCGISAEG